MFNSLITHEKRIIVKLVLDGGVSHRNSVRLSIDCAGRTQRTFYSTYSPRKLSFANIAITDQSKFYLLR